MYNTIFSWIWTLKDEKPADRKSLSVFVFRRSRCLQMFFLQIFSRWPVRNFVRLYPSLLFNVGFQNCSSRNPLVEEGEFLNPFRTCEGYRSLLIVFRCFRWVNDRWKIIFCSFRAVNILWLGSKGNSCRLYCIMQILFHYCWTSCSIYGFFEKKI